MALDMRTHPLSLAATWAGSRKDTVSIADKPSGPIIPTIVLNQSSQRIVDHVLRAFDPQHQSQQAKAHLGTIARHTVELSMMPGSLGIEDEIASMLAVQIRAAGKVAAEATAWLIQQEAVPPKPGDPLADVPLVRGSGQPS